jgi:hypothetical protein
VFHGHVTNSSRTVFAVTNKILRPALSAASGWASAADLFGALPGFEGSRGTCGVAVGVFAGRGDPWHVAFFDDTRVVGVAGPDDPESRLYSGRDADLMARAFASLPECPEASGEELYIDADRRGVIEPEQECLVMSLREITRRPRRGTVLIDLVFGRAEKLRSPEGVLALVDDDRGRHLLRLVRLPDGRWRLWWEPGSPAKLAEFVDGLVDRRV